MKNKIIFILVSLLLMACDTAYADQLSITNDAYIRQSAPNTVFNDNDLNIGPSSPFISWRTYIQLPNIATINYLNLYVYSGSFPGDTYEVYNTGSFDETTLTYNNRPAPTTLITTGVWHIGWNNISFPGTSVTTGYILLAGTGGNNYIARSSEYGTPGFAPHQNYTNFTDGLVQWEEINGTIYPLEGALVFYNSTIFNYTLSDGSYTLYNVTDDAVRTVSKNNAFQTKTEASQNFILEYARPTLSTPAVSGTIVKSVYQHNHRPLNLWESPYFVWGYYDFSGNIVKTQCSYLGNSEFGCDIVPDKDYNFNMSFSDIYNYNAATYHPFLTENRTFFTSTIYISNSSIIDQNPGQMPRLSLENRENVLNDYFWDMLFTVATIILIISIASFFKRK